MVANVVDGQNLGQSLINIDIKDVLIAGAIGAVAPGMLAGSKQLAGFWQGSRYFANQVTKLKTVYGVRIKQAQFSHRMLANTKKLHSKIQNRIKEHNYLMDSTLQVWGYIGIAQTFKVYLNQFADDIIDDIILMKEDGCIPDFYFNGSETVQEIFRVTIDPSSID